MEFTEVVRRRRMVRRYDPDRPVPREAVLERACANAVRAPSAGFSQGWDFVVLDHAGRGRGAFWAATDGARRGRRPGCAASARRRCSCSACRDPDAYLDRYAEPDKGWTDRDEARWPVPYWDVDTGMAALLMLLTAVDAGPRRPLLRGAARAPRRGPGGLRHPGRQPRASSGSWPSGTRPSGPTSPSLRRRPPARSRGASTGAVSAWQASRTCQSAVGEDGAFDPLPCAQGAPPGMARERPPRLLPEDFAEQIVDIDVEEEMQSAFLEYAYSRHLLPRPARRPRRPQAGAAPHPVRR